VGFSSSSAASGVVVCASAFPRDISLGFVLGVSVGVAAQYYAEQMESLFRHFDFHPYI